MKARSKSFVPGICLDPSCLSFFSVPSFLSQTANNTNIRKEDNKVFDQVKLRNMTQNVVRVSCYNNCVHSDHLAT